ncbi:MAG: glycoside hydrolase family 2 protein, partial [Bacteroidales bacterium]|nr:glycoside hydrolase family 2 protein [Bacteroidales bacterium]
MKNLIFLIAIGLMLFQNCTESSKEQIVEKRQRLFNAEWKFIRDSVSGAEQPEYDDSEWRTLDLPHDWSIEDLPGEDGPDQIGPFSKKSPGNGNSTGHVIGGTGWYRKSFTLDKADEGKTAVLKFDGVYMESEVWVNGQKAGIHKNGYTPFWFDITSLLNEAGESNVIAVKVDNIGRNSRWYSGSGIYRNVHLILTQPVHVGVWGVNITTPEVSSNSAVVDVEVTAQNEKKKEVHGQITINIKDKNGKPAGTVTDDIELQPKSDNTIKKQINVQNPFLWSVESPNLYRAEIIIRENNKISDVYNQTFGIRSIEFSADKGFLLNGEPVLLKGGCIHHDNGLLGSAAIERAEERKVKILKANGYNAVRAAHNPHSKAFYDACDSLGMLVIGEFTDMWETYKTPQDYSRFFKEWWNKDLTNFILRDRNHPSIIMWSIGNEIYEQADSTRLRIAKQLTKRVRELDNTRAVTQAITGFFYPEGWESTAPEFELLDVCGYNYNWKQMEKDHEKYPERIMYSSESYTKQAYDYWKVVEKYPYVIGDFIWTAWDYLGEVSIGQSEYVPEEQRDKMSDQIENFSDLQLPEGVNIFDLQAKRPSNWPYYLANCGDIDITGEKNPQMLYRDVLWDNSSLEINVHEPIPEGLVEFGTNWAWPREWPHWNWQGNEGKPLQVRVFTKAPHVRLELNGEEVGEEHLSMNDKYIAVFEVPYQPGELKAIAIENGEEIASKVLKTTGEPAAIRLKADRSTIRADRND